MIPLRRPQWLRWLRRRPFFCGLIALVTWLIVTVAEYFVFYGMDRYMK